MMTPDIRQAYEALPPELQREAADFIEFLAQKWRRGPKQGLSPNNANLANKPIADLTPEELAERRQQGLGAFKGQIWMSDDFDEPLEDFKDYM